MDDQKPVSPDKNSRDTSNELLDQPYNDTQTETYVSPSGEPTTIAPLPTPLSLQKPKSHAGRWFLRGFVLLVIAGLAAFGYWQWTEAQSANNERASLQSALDTVKSANKTAGIIKEEDDMGGGKDLIPQTQITNAALDTVEAFMTTKGITRVMYEANIPYMDKDFARVQVDYVEPDATTGKNKPTGKSETFYFKRIERTPGDETWAMIGNNPTTTDEITSMKNRYGVSDAVITGSNPA